jgi:hypothetical protein
LAGGFVLYFHEFSRKCIKILNEVEMKNEILKCLRRIDTLPFLFVGSGLSIRYLGLENWEGLLRNFAKLANKSEFAYEQYLQQAKATECKEGLLPKVAELIEQDFFQVWYNADEYRGNRERYQDAIQKHTSPLKIEIAGYMQDAKILDIHQDELSVLRKIGKRSIAGILTTNYDHFLENIFRDYKCFIGQEELIFSSIQGIAEIYKIHGCCSKPESIVITERDYVDFAQKNAYLAAKILTLFLEHPVVFIGYSISDKNIENIMKAIVQCLSLDNLVKFKERLIFIEWNNSDQEDDISTYSKSFEGGKSIEMTRIKLKDYSVLYQALLENNAKYNAPMLRRLKEDIYELILTNKPTGKIRTIGLEDERLDDVEVVIGVGVLANFGQKGYAAISAAELYTDVIFDNGNYDADLIVQLTLPTLFPSHSYSLPIYKYLAGCSEDIPEKVKGAIKPDYDSLLSNTIKKNRERSPYRKCSFSELKARCTAEKTLQIAPCLKPENINIDELQQFLKEFLTQNPAILSSPSVIKSDVKRLIKIYDWLRYSDKSKAKIKEPRI